MSLIISVLWVKRKLSTCCKCLFELNGLFSIMMFMFGLLFICVSYIIGKVKFWVCMIFLVWCILLISAIMVSSFIVIATKSSDCFVR